MYRTERIFVVSALVVVGLALIVVLNRGLLAEADSQLFALVWLMDLALILIAAVGARWASVPANADAASELLIFGFPL